MSWRKSHPDAAEDLLAGAAEVDARDALIKRRTPVNQDQRIKPATKWYDHKSN